MNKRKGMLLASGATFLLLISGIVSGGFFNSRSTAVTSGATSDVSSQPLPIVGPASIDTASSGGSPAVGGVGVGANVVSPRAGDDDYSRADSPRSGRHGSDDDKPSRDGREKDD